MRIGPIPENFLERAVSMLGLFPDPLVTVMWGMTVSRAVIAAARLGLFDAIGEGEKDAGEIASATRCNPASLEALLKALNGFGFLVRRRGRYSLSGSTRKWLSGASRQSIADGVLFGGELWELLAEMEQAVRSGEGTNFHHAGKPESFWRAYMRGLASFARFTRGEVARKVPFARPPERVLDVAGGHGMYSAALCLRHPGLRVEVLDLPEAAKQGRELVAEEGLSERIVYREGDLRSSTWGEGYDGLLLFNILHTLTEPEAREAIQRARAALRPGGTLAIFDSEHEGGEGNLTAAAGFGELFFFLVARSRAWPEPTLRDWLAGAGFRNLRRRRLLTAPMTVFLCASAPD
ncbi:MAG: methyltransferase domain-containing protein [Myxococcales bacterium]|nr:methyltransferase domain-containing protein [Myxococcales bacterium]